MRGLLSLILIVAYFGKIAQQSPGCMDQHCTVVTELDCSDPYEENKLEEDVILIDSTPDCPIWNCSRTSATTECVPSNHPPPLPRLEFMHANGWSFVVKLNWEQYESRGDVTGYTLVMSDEPVDSIDDIPDIDVDDSCRKHCASLSPSATEIIFTDYYRLDSTYKNTRYLKLFSHPYCNYSEVIFTVPKNCHHVQPGNCNTCGEITPGPPMPVNIDALPTLISPGNMSALISWELPRESLYYNDFSGKSFYVNVTSSDGESTLLEVVGLRAFTSETSNTLDFEYITLGYVFQSDITVYNLSPLLNYSVKVKVYDCGCGEYSDPATFKLEPISVSPTPPLSPLPPSTGSSNTDEKTTLHHNSIIAIIAEIIIVLLLVIAVCLLVRHLHNRRPTRPKDPLISPETPEAIPISEKKQSYPTTQVALIYSEHSSVADKNDIESLAYLLHNQYTGISVRMQETENAGSPADWLEGVIRDGSMLLCVCNKEFLKEWDNGGGKRQSLISPLRQIVFGKLSYSEQIGMSRYMVVLLHTKYKKYVPDYLKNRKSFVSEGDLQQTACDIAFHVTGTPKATF